MPNSKPQFLLLSPWDTEPIEFSEFRFVTNQESQEVQGLICNWKPYPELLGFPKPKIWYLSEPLCSTIYKQELWKECLSKLSEDELLYHGHQDPYLRIPHCTHVGKPNVITDTENRQDRAIAVVSNRGENWSFQRSRQIQLRNSLSLSPSCDLYGQLSSWEKYRHRTTSFPRLPKNYCGVIEGLWSEKHKVRKLSEYKVSICLENRNSPYYFTEKFVDAVKAGCIPIYNPHPSVQEHFLRGAKWVNPEYFSSPEKCIRHALDQDINDYQQTNAQWLKSQAIQETEKLAIFEQLGYILLERIHG